MSHIHNLDNINCITKNSHIDQRATSTTNPSTEDTTNILRDYFMENIKSTNFSGKFHVSDFTKSIDEDYEIEVSDEVREYWERWRIKSVYPPLLTRPSIKNANELVNFIAIFI